MTGELYRWTIPRTCYVIDNVVCVPLVGESPKGGWANEIRPEDSVHAIIGVHTRDGPSGYGSCFTDGRLAREAVRILKPLLVGKNAIEVGRLTEELHQNTFWMGRGGTLTHAISGINIALVGRSSAKRQDCPSPFFWGGVTGTTVKPYASMLMDEPDKMGDILSEYRAKGYRAFKIGWGPFGRRESFARDEAIIRASRDALQDR